MLALVLVLVATMLMFMGLFIWAWFFRSSINCSEATATVTVTGTPTAEIAEVMKVEEKAPEVIFNVEPAALVEIRSDEEWDDYWASLAFEMHESIPLRDESSGTRIPCELLFIVSVYLSTSAQAAIVAENLRTIRALYPEAIICVVDNGSVFKYDMDASIVFVDNTEWVKKGFGYEFSGYLTALEKYDPAWAVCIQGSLVLQKRFEVTDLIRRQPDMNKQIFAVKYFPSLGINDAEDGRFICHASQLFGSVPKTRSACNGVFGTNFIAAKVVLDVLKAGLLRIQVNSKVRSQATERILAIFMWNLGVDSAVQNLDGDLRYQSEFTRDSNPLHFWKVWFTQFK